ncbi:hypothetical protein AB8T27_19860 [Klebsiella pneumoniae]|uniref:hypothetical protein n=1 Tax=Klebsiella pneumoniae TaxID=573 RepID=UPI00115B01F1|nr:hypothetical protein [Klebsiella pneumoniae]QJK69832.1 hypothetical protein HJX21_07065 [Klebsiella pneumoniae]HBR6221368.1 hypothetical protein [Klebsiella pneumoniae]HCI5291605.1 hypothetical protein [Klebsiella pneumoniae]
MTTDITELAHGNSLRKKLNRRLNDAYGFQRTSGGKHTTISLSIAECKSVIAALDERLSLVEALEKAQQVDEELCKLLPPGAEYMDPPDGGDITPLEGVRRMVADYRQRIAELENYAEAEAVGADKVAENAVYWMKRCKELESRTVKLPQRHSMLLREDFNEDYHTEMAYKADEVQASLSAAGIKVEAE